MTSQAFVAVVVWTLVAAGSASAQTRIQIMPPDGIVIASGQRFDVRVEATTAGSLAAPSPARLTVSLNGQDMTGRNQLDPGDRGERGAGGTGRSGPNSLRDVTPATPNSTNFLVQDFSIDQPATAARSAGSFPRPKAS